MEHYRSILAGGGNSSSSEMERRADEAERETSQIKESRIYAGASGEEFEGVIIRNNKMGHVCGTSEYDRRSGSCSEYDG